MSKDDIFSTFMKFIFIVLVINLGYCLYYTEVGFYYWFGIIMSNIFIIYLFSDKLFLMG